MAGRRSASRRLGGLRLWRALQVFAEQVHVEVAVFIDPLFVGLDGERLDQPQATGFVGEDAHKQRAAFDLLVQPLEQIGRLEMFVVRPGKPVKGEGLVDVRLDPRAQLRMFILPAHEPRGQIAPRFLGVVPVVDPAQFDQAIIRLLARQVIERVAQEVDVTPLPIGFGQRLHNRAFESGVIVADRQLHAVQAAFFQAHQMIFPAAHTLAPREFDGQHVPAAVPTDPERDQDRAALADAVFPHSFVARIEDDIRIRFFQSALHEAAQFLVHRHVQFADGAGTELVPAQFLGDRLHPARLHALHIHLHQRGHQGLLAALIPGKQLGREPALPILRHA